MVADRIHHQLAVTQCTATGDAGTRQKRRTARHTAPDVDAAKVGRRLIRIELTTYRRMEAVTGNRHIGIHRMAGRSGVKLQRHALIVLAEAAATMADLYHIRPESCDHRIQEHPMQIGAVKGKMRPVITGMPAAGFAVDQLTMLIEKGEFPGLDTNLAHRDLQPELKQPAHGMRKQIDAHPQRLVLGHRLIYPTVDALLMEV